MFLTASCIAKNSFRRASRVCVSASIAAFVIAFGGGGAFGFGAIRREEASSIGVFEVDLETLDSRGVATESSPVSSFSSSANESLLLASGFFFFFFGGPSLRDGDALLLRSVRIRYGENRTKERALTHPSVTSLAEGVSLLELPDVNLPSDLSCASFSFCSRTSARRLRKSERWTRPTVCDLSKSSADAVWLVKDRGFEELFGCSDGGIMYGAVFIRGS